MAVTSLMKHFIGSHADPLNVHSFMHYNTTKRCMLYTADENAKYKKCSPAKKN